MRPTRNKPYKSAFHDSATPHLTLAPIEAFYRGGDLPCGGAVELYKLYSFTASKYDSVGQLPVLTTLAILCVKSAFIRCSIGLNRNSRLVIRSWASYQSLSRSIDSFVTRFTEDLLPDRQLVTQ